MTSPKDKHKAAETFREATEILESLELFDAWEQKRFRDEVAVQAAQRYQTRARLEARLRDALAWVLMLPKQQQATFPFDRAKRVMGGA